MLVGDRLGRAFPDHVVIGEEAAGGARPARPDDARYAWYLDPIDGTTNFAHGHPHFAVSLALARGADWTVRESWTDKARMFLVHALAASD